MATFSKAVTTGADDQHVHRSGAAYPPTSAIGRSSNGATIACNKDLSAGKFWTRVGLLRFDTSGLPDDAVISSAYLLVFAAQVSNANGRSVVGDWHGWNGAGGDFAESVGTSAIGGVPLSTFSAGAVKQLVLQNADANVNRTGPTLLRLGISGSAPTANNRLNIGSFEGGGTPPTLVIDYTVGSVEQTPATPTNLKATGASGGILLDWDDVTTPGLDGYNVYRSDTPDGTKTKLNGGPVAASTFTDTSGRAGTTYYYAVTALNGEASTPESGRSNEASAAPTAGGTGLDGSPTVNRNFNQPPVPGSPHTAQTIDFAAQGVELTAGRLAVVDIVVDGDVGEFLTVPGWNKQADVSGPGVSIARYTRLADGTEAGVTVGWETGAEGSSIKISEWNVPEPQVEAANPYGTGGEVSASGTMGPPPSATQNLTVAIASVGVGSLASWAAGSVSSWSGGFVSLGPVPADGGPAPGLEVAALGNVASGSSPQTSATWSEPDEWAGILTLVRSGPPPAPSGTAEKPRVGAATADGFQVAADVSGDVSGARLRVSNAPDLFAPKRFDATIGTRTVNGRRVMKATATGLDPNTRYYYGWELNGGNYGSAGGSAKTFPRPGEPHSGTIVGATCHRTNTPFAVGDDIQAIDPDLFVHYGDLHYRDETSTDAAVHTGHMQYAMAITKLSNVFRNHNTLYVMDDHERENAAHVLSSGMAASNTTWDEYFPHYAKRDAAASAQDMTPVRYGRVWLIPLDTRSYRDRWTVKTDATRTMLGAAQKQAFIDFCAAHPGEPKLVFMGSPWIGGKGEDDHWGAYQAERSQIVGALRAAGVRNVVMIAGDMHAVASDDGRNSPGGYPVFHWAPFDQVASRRGGPYLNGPHPASGTAVVQQLGRIDVVDTGGDHLNVTFRGLGLGGANQIPPLTVTMTAIGGSNALALVPSGRRSTTNLTSDGQGWLRAD